MKWQTSADKLVQQQYIFTDYTDDLEGSQMIVLVMDVEEDNDKLYNYREFRNKINKLIYRK